MAPEHNDIYSSGGQSQEKSQMPLIHETDRAALSICRYDA